MKIKTITCHNVYNYGASLQAYALQHYLQSKGHDVEIIDYYPLYFHHYEWFYPNKSGRLFKYAKRWPFLAPLIALIQHRWMWKQFPMKRAFDDFTKNYLRLTKIRYRSICDFKNNKLEADVFIAGSDQIWNTDMLNGLDPIFYLMFEPNRDKCISYAASFAMNDIPNEYETFVKSGLGHLSSISIREKTGVILAKKLGFEATNVLDPVFLLSIEEWDKICVPINNKRPYLLLYDFQHNNPLIPQIAQSIASERGLDIVSIYTRSTYSQQNVMNAGPLEFISWIKNADMVIANSFHATAFSIIFNRDFYTLPLVGRKCSSRMQDLLAFIGLSDRFITGLHQIFPAKHIDYSIVIQKLHEKQQESRMWLLNAISGNK